MNDFKVLKYLCTLLLSVVIFSANAQEEEEITEEELTKYAEVMLEVDEMKEEGKEKYIELIKSNELMQKGKRFNEIKKANGDEAKLAELNVTEEEMAAYNSILEENDKIAAEIKETFSQMVKEDLGAASYNKIKRKLKADDAFKTKYEELYQSLQSTDEETTDTDDEEKD